jgi:hypothetical protein
LLAREENLTGLARRNRELVARAEGVGSPHRVLLDMDSSESPVYGEQEQSAYNGYFESVCYHPLFLFNRQGDCLVAIGNSGYSRLASYGNRLQKLQYRLFRTRRSAAPSRWDDPQKQLRSNRSAGSRRVYPLHDRKAKKEIPVKKGK